MTAGRILTALGVIALGAAAAIYFNRPTEQDTAAAAELGTTPLALPAGETTAVPAPPQPAIATPVTTGAASAAVVPAQAEPADEPEPLAVAPEPVETPVEAPKPPKEKKRKPAPTVAEAPAQPVAPVAAPVVAAPVVAASTLDAQYEARRGECKTGFFGSSCRKKIRVSLCAGKWADNPEAGMKVCQTKNQ